MPAALVDIVCGLVQQRLQQLHLRGVRAFLRVRFFVDFQRRTRFADRPKKSRQQSVPDQKPRFACLRVRVLSRVCLG